MLYKNIDNTKYQVTQVLNIYGDYLKIKNDNLIDGEKEIELLECIEKTTDNHNHENERPRINFKWVILTGCGIWYRKLDLYEKAVGYFEKVF
ncbi:unnamed protein product [Adineta steineri]|uniref:Uncharacterized protein n=1 Tax=Adineta steineri TaxID=433720 RepID=A0A819WU73_9BILA|nr:unnamed protein product [Adineta steineri]CAF4131926.1 unnamed protein product [Adineta steineri]